MSDLLKVSNKGKCVHLDDEIVKGFALAIIDASGGFTIGRVTDGATGKIAPELFPTSSQARKERGELIQELGYDKDDFVIAPAKWSQLHSDVTLYDKHNDCVLTVITMDELAA